MPFGLNCAPSYFQRLMESTLQGLAWEICLPYLDDIAVWSSGSTPEQAFQQGLDRLDLVLERLEWAGLTCKPPKCSLFARSVEYLGHVRSAEGVSLDRRKSQLLEISILRVSVPSRKCAPFWASVGTTANTSKTIT